MSSVVRLFALFMSLLLLTGCTLKGTPRHSLAELKAALMNRDSGEALKYIDVDSIVDHLVDDALARRESRNRTGLDALGTAIGKGIASAVLPQAKDLIRKQVRAAVESEDQAGYFEQIRRASVWYFSIEEENGTALVTPRRDDKVRFRMERTHEGYWKIVQIMLKRRE